MKFYQNRRFVRGPAATGKRPAKRTLNPLKVFKSASNPRKALFGAGSLSFMAGVGLLAFGLFTAFGGSDGKPPEGPPAVQLVVTPTPVHSPTPPPVTATPSPTPVPAPPLGDHAYEMIISSLGIDAPVQEYGLDENQVPEVPTGPGNGPGQIVAWYNFSSKPGTGGNAVFAGHVTWNGAGVFYNLTSVAVGDDIVLKGDDGTTVTYKVSSVFSVSATDPNARSVMGPTPTDELTILTCDGTTTYVGGQFGVEYDNRLVVRADLQGVVPAGATPAAAAAATAAGAG